jgi:hypothetical protein
MKDPKAPPSARVSAATAIVDRGHCKPHQVTALTQTVAMDVQTTNVLNVSHITDMAELEALERALNATIARQVPTSRLHTAPKAAAPIS